jgi:hypothetical protein
MMAEVPEGGSGKTRKRPAAKAASGQGSAKCKVTLHLSSEADKRLSIHSTMMEIDRSTLVELLIQTHLKRWVVSDRGSGGEAASGDAAA